MVGYVAVNDQNLGLAMLSEVAAIRLDLGLRYKYLCNRLFYIVGLYASIRSKETSKKQYTPIFVLQEPGPHMLWTKGSSLIMT